MDTAVHNQIVGFIWSTADDCLRDVVEPMAGLVFTPAGKILDSAYSCYDGAQAGNISFGSTLSGYSHSAREFDFMLSNPPCGKS
jgi:type I restriction-modification system DNA methylase subunit